MRHVRVFYCLFSTRQHIAYMISALYAITRPSVCLTVRHTGGSYKNSWR